MNRSWMYVILTCLFELLWVFGFNVASSWWHWAIILGIITVDFHFLAKACEKLPTGTVYAIFAGAGTVGTALMDVLFFGGSLSVGKIVFMIMLIAGVIGLKLADQAGSDQKQKGVA
ncbi:multidrug efflux SMR transporter [Paenibacillus alvei]|uniref:DMT family transporter n=1 Tax=Paenibacillus alvei TaxID=44250 RepID=UPI0013DB03D1|nr:multidrug efflux SMR transporter [Paenibacillus alvei]MBG9733451.1 ligand-binding protein SH3 [Paenibacillus alvei]MBG9742694.1 ligand-binding protein SH3 [Paenibacillus alvei]MCY9581485.1 multidrug efflux SMR transporter [Paenibacillus alvei]MCY9585508.1 multidrug efflux SMR transporter [Paenibacillus alvei]NEZ41816.1 QacE family quaternary ammonium compound efflux SMR transporter [Paenibacillus alvei]